MPLVTIENANGAQTLTISEGDALTLTGSSDKLSDVGPSMIALAAALGCALTLTPE